MWTSHPVPCKLLWLLGMLSGSKSQLQRGDEVQSRRESHAVSRNPHSGSQLGIHTREITQCQVFGHREYLVTSWSSQPNAQLQVSRAVLNTASPGQPPALGCWLMPPRTGMTQQTRGSCFQKASRALSAHCTGFWHILFCCFLDACQLCTNSSGMQ